VPQIDWKALPYGRREHLYDRLRTREITARDLEALWDWVKTDPVVPNGRWYKDFGSFKLVGTGNMPQTFLTKDQAATGERVE
jgi:RNAse (barnase) inhibitor barstar